MIPEHLSFRPFALVGMIMLVLSGVSSGYLLSVHRKSRSSWMLLGNFVCLIFSSMATILANSGPAWDWAFAPAQDAFLILGGVFLVRFAYRYPRNDQPKEARLATGIVSLLALGALSYSVFFAVQYIASLPAGINENQAYYLLTPLTLLLVALIFLRRAQHFSRLPESAAVRHSSERTNQQHAQALRWFGFALAIGLVPTVVVVTKFYLPPLLASFLFNMGAIVAISMVMLVYLNYAPEPTTITAKLIGVSLVTLLLILGMGGVWFTLEIPAQQTHSVVLRFIILVLVSSLAILLLFPLFFRSTLLKPLANLLSGVRAVNAGQMDTQVAVQYNDEIGYLTHSFNRLVDNLAYANQALRESAENLEAQVSERTAELLRANQRLVKENSERLQAESQLDQQLRYEQALAACSQSLMVVAVDEESQQQVFEQALEHLRRGAQASRAYIFRNDEDPDLGLCMGMLAEVCAAGVRPQINNPANRRFPYSMLPAEMFEDLSKNQAYGGPVEQVFASTPEILATFRNQAQALLSLQIFPIFVEERWWGFLGFDEVTSERQWSQAEVLMLRTASEMIGSAIQRWQTEEQLQAALEHLEQRVQERTLEFAQANAALKHEIYQRQHFQSELEEWLKIERTLAEISARLLSPLGFQRAVRETLADLGAILQAEQVVYLQFNGQAPDGVEQTIEWHAPQPSRPGRLLETLLAAQGWLVQTFEKEQANPSLLIKNLDQLPQRFRPAAAAAPNEPAGSVVVAPLFVENRLAGMVACGGLTLPAGLIAEKQRPFEVVAGMLSGLLQREILLTTLENQVTERTRELAAFFDVAMLAGQANDLESMLQPALAKIMEISRCEAVCIHLQSEDKTRLQLVAQRGIPSNILAPLSEIRLESGDLDWLDAPAAGANIPLPTTFHLPGFTAAPVIRLRTRGRLQGMLCCYRMADRPFTPYQISILNGIGEQLGVMIENQRLQQEAEELAILEERQRVARELHDSVTQTVYSLSLFAHAGQDALDEGNRDKLADSLQMLEQNSLQALKEMRLLLYQLRSPELEYHSLSQALQMRLDQVERRTGIRAEIAIDESVQLPKGDDQEVFRIISEALNNALKHANASQVRISLQQVGEVIQVEVFDNGAGFEPGQPGHGIGLNSMRARARSLGGDLQIDSQPGAGTIVRLRMPAPAFKAFNPKGAVL